MIRAVIGSLGGGAAVGGFIEPANRPAVFAPYVALLGVIAAVTVIIYRKPENWPPAVAFSLSLCAAALET
jgi:hypothetical protein